MIGRVLFAIGYVLGALTDSYLLRTPGFILTILCNILLVQYNLGMRNSLLDYLMGMNVKEMYCNFAGFAKFVKVLKVIIGI